MPIRPDLRHFYSGAEWRETRQRILARADNRCEKCRAQNGETYVRVQLQLRRGSASAGLSREYLLKRVRRVVVQLGVAHLDHDPSNNADDNLRALCRRCHLLHDRGKHKETRSIRKDAARPLLAVSHG